MKRKQNFILQSVTKPRSNENENFNLNIKDYGKGMDNKTKNDFSNGLRNMQMRAEQIQSLFKLITAPGKGVQIVVEGKLY